MEPCGFKEENRVLGPPQGMTEEEVASLSVWQGLDTDETPLVISCWKITKEELEEIQRTGRVWLMVYGASMPPVALQVKTPFNT